jgi:hypothetical protein
MDTVFVQTVRRLSRQSVDKHYDAYADVPWDDPDFAIDAEDPRWNLWDGDAMGQTDWYRSQPPGIQARVGLHRMAAAMRVGTDFENILQRGLLAFAYKLPDGSPEFRYLHHEVVEESHHQMMFQEFVSRTGLDVAGLPGVLHTLAEKLVIPLNRLLPPLFFLFVLGGEDPVDHIQRQRLRSGIAHPLLERIMRIHVTEEARHISFARQYLREEVPKLSTVERMILAGRAPILFGIMVRLMADPPRHVVQTYGIPNAVMAEVRRSPLRRQLLVDCAAKPRQLCQDLGLISPRTEHLWRWAGLAA